MARNFSPTDKISLGPSAVPNDWTIFFDPLTVENLEWWHNFAITCKGTEHKVFVDGVQVEN